MFRTRYSYLIQPISIAIDFFIINAVIYWLANQSYQQIPFYVYMNLSWWLIAYYFNFYRFNRVTKGLRILSLILIQFIFFSTAFLTYFGLFVDRKVNRDELELLLILFVIISIVKFLLFYALKIYRNFGKNYRKVIFIGLDSSTKKLSKFFTSQEDFGFRNLGFFSNKENNSKKYLGEINDSFDFIIENEVDEIYVSSQTAKETIKKFFLFANTYQKVVRLIPETKDLYRRNLEVEYYGSLPILKVKELPLEKQEVRFFKRTFDIIFSLVIIVFLLLWLIPILYIVVKIDSKGPLFFKQKRSGYKGKEFYCLKFRSMRLNDQSDIKQVSKEDKRITKVGRFLRKSSIDELPQFFNVLIGDMSVVGPRPHMSEQSLAFEKEINKYILRNAVKPGITGLAQVSGYRGEIKNKSDIENRVRLDIFYIENWSFFLDVKIVLKTVLNLFSGEEKAY